MRKKVSLIVMLVSISILVLTSCGGKGEHTSSKNYDKWLIGSWEMYNKEGRGSFFWELYFYDDGTVAWDEGETDDFAKWAIVNGNQLKFTYDSSLYSIYSGIEVWSIEMDNAYHLKLTDEDGNYMEYNKQ